MQREKIFSELIKKLRKQTGLSGKQAAKNINISATHWSRIEQGLVPKDSTLDKIIAFLKPSVMETKLLMSLAKKDHQIVVLKSLEELVKTQETLYSFLEVENKTMEISINFIPALLQIPDYTRFVRTNDLFFKLKQNQIEELIHWRKKRQERLLDPTKHFYFILPEFVLRDSLCVPIKIMTDQIEALLERQKLKNVEILIFRIEPNVQNPASNLHIIGDHFIFKDDNSVSFFILRENEPDYFSILCNDFNVFREKSLQKADSTEVMKQILRELKKRI